MNKKRISISPDIIAVIETTNNKMIKFYEIATGKPLNFTLEHSLPILEIHLNQTEQSLERKVAFFDINRDLYIAPVHKSDRHVKIGTICDSFMWHDKFDILVSISDAKLHTFFYPNVVYVDINLLENTTSEKEASELGRLPQITNYSDSQVTVRRKDGAIVTLGNSPYPTLLFDFCEKGKWEKAMKLCRFVKEPLLWACLAAISLKVKQLDTAETAFAAIEQPEKVSFISELRENPSEIVKNATMALLLNKQSEAEQIYVQNKFYYHAIEMHVNGYRWERALKLARDFKCHLEIVVYFRNKYLKRIGKEETNKEMIKAAQEAGEIDEAAIEQKIEEERGRKK